jgi:hypothetical protein
MGESFTGSTETMAFRLPITSPRLGIDAGVTLNPLVVAEMTPPTIKAGTTRGAANTRLIFLPAIETDLETATEL